MARFQSVNHVGKVHTGLMTSIEVTIDPLPSPILLLTLFGASINGSVWTNQTSSIINQVDQVIQWPGQTQKPSKMGLFIHSFRRNSRFTSADTNRKVFTEKRKAKTLRLLRLIRLVVILNDIKNCFSINYIINLLRRKSHFLDVTRRNTGQIRRKIGQNALKVDQNTPKLLFECSFWVYVYFDLLYVYLDVTTSSFLSSIFLYNSMSVYYLKIFFSLLDVLDVKDVEKTPLGYVHG